MTCERVCGTQAVFNILQCEFIERSAQVRPSFDFLPKLLGEIGQDVCALQSFRRLANKMADIVVEQRQQDRRQVANELVKCGSLHRRELVVHRPDAIQDGMPGFVGDDVVRKAGIARVLLVTEIVELQRFAMLVVKSIFTKPGMRHNDQAVAIETPRHRAAQGRGLFVEFQHTLHNCPCIQLVKIRILRPSSR